MPAASACRRLPGRRRTARSPTPSAASRASGRSCRRPARRGRIGGSSPRSRERLGFGEAFAWQSAADIFREHAALSAFENDGTRDFDIGAYADLDDRGYESLAPFVWPAPADGKTSGGRFFADGGFFHPDRRARFIAIAPRAPVHGTTGERPLRLNTGRVRDQWHTMTRTGKSVRLAGHRPEPVIELHPTRCHVRATSPTATSPK